MSNKMSIEKLRRKVIVLPGFSVKNKEWAYEVKQKLGDDVEVVEWEHWRTGKDEDFVADKELLKIENLVRNEKVYVVAKSVGTYVAMLLLKEEEDKIEKLILCGVALNDFSDDEKEKFSVLKSIDSDKLLVIQNDEDPHGSCEEVKKFVHGFSSNIKIVERKRNDHNYPYYSDFIAYLFQTIPIPSLLIKGNHT
jgi:predicted alpha/beta hydrolase family esterase